ncbi:PEGA domain-containing protein [Pedobacter sp. SD-b]|uniref:PEGA domain-containing protein n=1 Tax=Pedobacter segetis TaxID=2793069 RepID=A0ABS1BLD0_9SPHI|nr:PEGA domain-containing protein [Pedobacter segetis]MBK0383556.1 PEGA domain-containing protein [Pedobacter segetis]
MNKNYILPIAFCGLLTLQSCATIFTGNKTGVKIPDGTPSGAKVFVNGKLEGITPKRVQIPKNALKQGAKITIKAEGYKPTDITINRKVQIGMAVLDVVTGGVWLIVDFVTGNIYTATPDKVKYELEKQ